MPEFSGRSFRRTFHYEVWAVFQPNQGRACHKISEIQVQYGAVPPLHLCKSQDSHFVGRQVLTLGEIVDRTDAKAKLASLYSYPLAQ
jgi:hypothetical protein